MTELKPCPVPWCGGAAKLVSGAPGCHYIQCTACGLETTDGSADRVTALWNTRPPARRRAMTDRAREVAEKLERCLNTNGRSCAHPNLYGATEIIAAALAEEREAGRREALEGIELRILESPLPNDAHMSRDFMRRLCSGETDIRYIVKECAEGGAAAMRAQIAETVRALLNKDT